MSLLDAWSDRIRTAASRGTPLRVRGGGTKDFYGGVPIGDIFDTTSHAGIVAYEPTELYVTARCGTKVADLEAALDERGQMLAFEPPRFGTDATIGGTIASGLSGPRRAQCGAARDFVLGIEMLDGRGDRLRFGGTVMKNVAGYDVSRLMCGSLGTLGLLTEVTLKVLPRPVAEITLRFELTQADAIQRMNEWAGRPLPISGTYWHGGTLAVRLSAPFSALAAARERLGGEPMSDVESRDLWDGLREQTLPAFGAPLWRISVPSTTPPLDLAGEPVLEWNGALRWLVTDADATRVRSVARAAGGHAALFRADAGAKRGTGAFDALPASLVTLHRRIKQTLDPKGVFNRSRLYPDF